jgi:hypothetical protein
VAGLGSNDSFLAESFVINWAKRDIPEFKSRCPNALRDPSRPNIWGRTRLDRLDVGVTAINFWSGGTGHYLNSKAAFGASVLALVRNHRDSFQVL